MPNSLRIMIKKLAHKGRISSAECDELLMKLDGHDAQIRADERKKVLHEQRALDVNLQISAEELRADERRKFKEWFKKSNHYLCYSDTIEKVMEEYEKEQK